VAAVIAALLVASIFAVRRRRGTGRGASPDWEEPAAGSAALADRPAWEETAPSEAIPTPTPESAALAAAMVAASAPSTMEAPPTPEPVMPPLEPTPPVAKEVEPSSPGPDPLAAALAAVPVSEAEFPPEPAPMTPTKPDPGTVAESKFDIDSIFAELDAISGEILKPASRKLTGTKPPGEDEDRTDEGTER